MRSRKEIREKLEYYRKRKKKYNENWDRHISMLEWVLEE